MGTETGLPLNASTQLALGAAEASQGMNIPPHLAHVSEPQLHAHGHYMLRKISGQQNPLRVHVEWGHGLSVVATKGGDVPTQGSQEATAEDRKKRDIAQGEEREGSKEPRSGREQGVRSECGSHLPKDGPVGGRQGGTEAEACDS